MTDDRTAYDAAKLLMAAAGYARNAGVDVVELHRLVDTAAEGSAIIPQMVYLHELDEMLTLEFNRHNRQ